MALFFKAENSKQIEKAFDEINGQILKENHLLTNNTQMNEMTHVWRRRNLTLVNA